MLARRILLASAVALAATSMIATPAVLAQDAAPEVANAAYQFAGEITANGVYVRSGPREGDYATMKLDKGAEVTVVGIKFDWLKILPPEGSFSYVSKAFVQQYGDGKRGRVTKNDLRVRAGSSMNQLKSQVQTSLMENDEVEILGEQDEYFKIKPPAGAYLYVKKDFVRPIRKLGTAAATPQPQPVTPPPVALHNDDEMIAPQPQVPAVEGAPLQEVAATTTTPEAAAPQATPDQAAAAGERFNKLEEQYRATASLPIDQQPLDELLAGYQPLAEGNELPDTMRRIAQHRVKAIQQAQSVRQELAAIRKEHEEIKARRMALKAEQEELEQNLRANSVEIFTAVGTLRASSLQRGPERLYRVTDPQSGRTLVYIRSNDPAVAAQLNQFVGVRGEAINDPSLNLNVISPTLVKPVDINKVNNGVAAQILPPSLLSISSTAAAQE